MKKSDLLEYTSKRNEGLLSLASKGQSEYAHGEEAFDNFNRLAAALKMDRKKILWVYLQKHLDGVVSYLHGHKSQREHIQGRLDDISVYINILSAMIMEEDMQTPAKAKLEPGKAIRLNPNEDLI